MAQKSFIYKFFFLLLLFSIAIVVPLFLLLDQNSRHMLAALEGSYPLSPEQKLIQSHFLQTAKDNLISITFYVFMLAFLISIFLGRRFLKPIKELYRGAMSIKEGKYDLALEVSEGDEFHEVVTAFNDMALALKNKTTELTWKERYVSMMTDPLWVINTDNTVKEINPAFSRLFGYGEDDILGSSAFDFLDNENERTMKRNLQENLLGNSTAYELSIISKSGDLIPVLISVSPVYGENGEIAATIGIMKDFRRETRLREELKTASEYHRIIMDSMPEVMLVVDPDLRIIIANKAAREEAGGDVLGRTCHEVFHSLPVDCSQALGRECPVLQAFKTGSTCVTLSEQTGKEKISYLEVTAIPVRDETGAFRKAIVLSRNVTEKKLFEDAIALKNKELSTLLEISRTLSRSLKPEAIFNPVLEKLIDFSGMDGGGIFLLDEKGTELACKYHKGFSQDYINSLGKIRIKEALPGRVAASGQGFTCPDLAKEFKGDSMFLKAGVRALACFPMKGIEKMIGVFCLFSFSPHDFTPEEERIFNSVGEMAAMAFENIRFYEKMRTLYQNQKWRREDEQKSFLEITTALARSLDVKEMLDTALSMLKQYLRADAAWYLELDETGALVARSVSGMEAAPGDAVYPPESNPMEAAAIRQKAPVIISEFENLTYTTFPGLSGQGYKTACSFPVHSGEKVTSALSLFASHYRDPKEDDIFFIQTVASILGMAMERARLYETFLIGKGLSDTMLETLEDALLMVDLEGHIVSMNSSAERLTGSKLASSIGLFCGDIFGYSEENEKLRIIVSECICDAGKGIPREQEVFITLPEKDKIPVVLSSYPVRKNSGKIDGILFVFRDTSRVEEIDRLKSEFLRSVSHEFRNPLTTMLGFSEMLLDGGLDPEKEKAFLGAVLSEGRKLSEMVDDLLDITAIESGRHRVRMEQVDLEKLFCDVLEEFTALAEKKGIVLKLRLSGEISSFMGDNEKLKRLFRNLLDNSLKYSEKGSKVEISVVNKGESFEITLKDTGWGIPEEDLKRIGDKFFRGRRSSAIKGKGLGLSIAREIVKVHGGFMEINSSAGKGTTVRLSMPGRRTTDEQDHGN